MLDSSLQFGAQTQREMIVNSDEEMEKDEIEEQEKKRQQMDRQRQQKEVPVVSNPPPTPYSPPPQSNQSPKSPSPQADETHDSDGFMELEDEHIKPPSPLVHSNRSFRAEPLVVTKELGTEAQEVSFGQLVVQKEGSGSGVSGLGSLNRRKLRTDLSSWKRTNRGSLVKRVLLGFRICGFVFCLISRGWALDSFYRY